MGKSKYINMDKLSSLAFDVASKFEKYSLSVFAQQMSAQAADIKAAVASVFGLIKKGSDYEFDVNSKPADIIFGIMDKANFKGDVYISLSVDSNKKGTLMVVSNPENKAVSINVKNALQNSVNAALAKMQVVPADTITIDKIVTASAS